MNGNQPCSATTSVAAIFGLRVESSYGIKSSRHVPALLKQGAGEKTTNPITLRGLGFFRLQDPEKNPLDVCAIGMRANAGDFSRSV